MTMTLVSTVTVGTGGAASIDFTSIPQTGTDLLVAFSLRSDRSDNYINVLGARFNSDSGSNYTVRILEGDGSAASSLTATTTYLRIGSSPAATATANTFGNGTLYIPNYTGSTAKSASSDVSSENNSTDAREHIIAGSWTGTSAITSLSLISPSFNWVQYSTASLYTITKGSGGASVS